jgi:hypothetical protein
MYIHCNKQSANVRAQEASVSLKITQRRSWVIEYLGRLIVKTHPVPGTLRTFRDPSCNSTLRRAMDKPNPSPLLSTSFCVNGRNIFSASPDESPPQ